MASDLKDRNAQLFVSLVIGLVQAAYVQLGKVKNEMTGQVERHLEAAHITIDTLAALESKTTGNLAPRGGRGAAARADRAPDELRRREEEGSRACRPRGGRAGHASRRVLARKFEPLDERLAPGRQDDRAACQLAPRVAERDQPLEQRGAERAGQVQAALAPVEAAAAQWSPARLEPLGRSPALRTMPPRGA